MNADVRVPVKMAAKLIQRDPSRVYAWVREGRLTVWENTEGVTHVSVAEVQELEAIMHKRRNNRSTHRRAA